MPQTQRTSQADHFAHAQRALRTGKSLAAYARDHDLDVQALYNARWRRRSQSGFVRVQVEQAPVGPSTPTPVVIRLPNGITVSASMTTDLSALVRTLLPL